MGQLDSLLKKAAADAIFEFDSFWDEFTDESLPIDSEEAVAFGTALEAVLPQLRAWKAKHKPNFTGSNGGRVICTDRESVYFERVGVVVEARTSHCLVDWGTAGMPDLCEKKRSYLRAAP